MSSLCKESLVDSRVHVTNLYNKLMDMLTEQGDPGQKLQVSSLIGQHYQLSGQLGFFSEQLKRRPGLV